MKKIVAAICIVISALVFSACSLLDLTKGSNLYDNDDEIAYQRLEQVVEAISNKDRAALKAMFSKRALADDNNFNESLDYVFELFQGSVKTVTNYGPGASEDIDGNGHVTKELTSWHRVNTDKQKYIFFLVEYIKDDNNPDNVGLYTLRVIKAKDEKTQFGYFDDMKLPGIYMPN